MYLRAVHAEAEIRILQQLILENPLGIFTTAIKSPNHPLIQSSHIPFVLDVPSTAAGETNSNGDDDEQNLPKKNAGILRGHMAKQNPQAKVLMEAAAQQQQQQQQQREGQDMRNLEAVELPEEVLVLFHGPHHHYVTPKFYTETKPQTGKVVPTWDYVAAQAYGKDPSLLRFQIGRNEYLS